MTISLHQKQKKGPGRSPSKEGEVAVVTAVVPVQHRGMGVYLQNLAEFPQQLAIRRIKLPVKAQVSPSLRESFQRFWRAVSAVLAMVLLAPLSTFAQTTGGGAAAFTTAAKQIVDMIRAISGPAILLLIVAGFALLMWGGVSEAWKRRALSIIGCAIIGAGLLFLFADPLATFLLGTFQTGGGTGGGTRA